MKQTNKISIIGAGFVGSATTLTMATSTLASHIVLVDINKEKAEGEVLDIAHGASFLKAVDITAGDYKDTANSDIVIITAGAGQKPGETRLDLISKNVAIFKTIIPQVVRYSPNAILLIVANPVDILTYIAYKLSGLPANKVIGSGTVLDTSRLRYNLSNEFDIDARNIHGYIIGEHGDSEFPVWSSVTIGALPLETYCEKEGIDVEKLKNRVQHRVERAAYEIIDRKGYTNYAIALAVRRICEAILRDENSILTVSSYNSLEDIYYSIPSIIGRNGQIMKLCPKLTDEETKLLEKSKTILKDVVKEIKL